MHHGASKGLAEKRKVTKMLDFIRSNAFIAFAFSMVMGSEGQPTVTETLAAFAWLFLIAFIVVTLARLGKLAWENVRGY